MDIDAALEAIVGARPQAVMLASQQPQNVAFIQRFRADNRTDPNCAFIFITAGHTGTFPEEVGSEHWHDLYFFQSGPLVGDTNWIIANQYSAALRAHGTGEVASQLMQEGYIKGRLVVEILKGITAQNVTRQTVIDQVSGDGQRQTPLPLPLSGGASAL